MFEPRCVMLQGSLRWCSAGNETSRTSYAPRCLCAQQFVKLIRKFCAVSRAASGLVKICPNDVNIVSILGPACYAHLQVGMKQFNF